MWRPHVDPPFGGRDAGHGGGGRVPLVVDRFVVCRRLGRGWPRATGRWSGDPMPPQQGVLGSTREQWEAAQKHPSNHPTSQQRYRNMF